MAVRQTGAPDLINERYRIGEVLGEGGMGTVYRARDLMLERDVAVKLLRVDALGSEARERMLLEAKAIAKLNHPNIVQVHDAGQLPGPSDMPSQTVGPAVPYIVMELVDGTSLHQRPPRDFQSIVRIVRQICAALEHAHLHGIVHRDLKPENVLIGLDGVAKLMDFGLARSAASRITSEGRFGGTVLYLAPEIALGQELDGRADLYSLGVMLYEMVTGSLPFTDEDPLALVAQHLHAPVVAPRLKDPDVPLALERLILELMVKSRRERPASATVVGKRLSDMESMAPIWDLHRDAEIDRSASQPLAPWPLLGRAWRANRPIVVQQAFRGGRGAAVALALFGSTRPLQVALTSPEDYESVLELMTLPAWAALAAFAMAFFGGLQGFASSLAVAVADTLRIEGRVKATRIFVAALAGLVHAAYLVLFSLLDLFPGADVGPQLYIPVYVIYGLFLGGVLSFVIPPLGGARSTVDQLKAAAWVTLLLGATTVPVVYLVYGEQTGTVLPFRLGFAAALAFGLGLALRNRRPALSPTGASGSTKAAA